jgi:hypothetical protein
MFEPCGKGRALATGEFEFTARKRMMENFNRETSPARHNRAEGTRPLCASRIVSG